MIEKIIVVLIIIGIAFGIAYPFNDPIQWDETQVNLPPYTYLLVVTYRHELAAYNNEKGCEIARSFIEERNKDAIVDKATRAVECEIVFAP